MALRWEGDRLLDKMTRAQITGVNATMAACVIHAKQNHPWQNRTGILEGSINIADFARKAGGGVRGTWGSQDVKYAMFQELGTAKMEANPYLRPAADAVYPSLSGRIRAALR